MKLEAIREDRTRGGRSTYQCSYTLSSPSLTETRLPEMVSTISTQGDLQGEPQHDFSCRDSQFSINVFKPKREPDVDSMDTSDSSSIEPIPRLIQDILSVEHLWHNADKESDSGTTGTAHSDSDIGLNRGQMSGHSNTKSICESSSEIDLCNIADHRLYKIVKWCKSLPLFREIQVFMR